MMIDIDAAAEHVADQAQRFSAFTGVTKPNPTDRFFLVMGMTGSGKSTFIGRCTGRDVTVGHSLYSCTSSIDVFDFTWQGRRIYLVDTPGFNDTNRSDLDTLGVLAGYLGASYANGVRIHGILMLHPISDNRMSGSSLRNIEMMKAMCGAGFYDNLAVATTMWPENPSHEETVTLNNREAELMADDRFFGALLDGGAGVYRHNENGRRDAYQEMISAQRIISHLIQQSDDLPPDPLRLQREIIDHGKTLGETAAGIVVAGELYKARQQYKRQLSELENELKGEMAKFDANHAQEIRELKAEAQKKLDQVEQEKQALKKTMEDMHREEEKALKERITALDRKLRARLAEKEEELQDMEESLRAVRREMARQSRPSQVYRIESATAEQEKIVAEARTEVAQAQGSMKKFQGHTGQILNGATNGIAAGATTALITAVAAGGLLCTVM